MVVDLVYRWSASSGVPLYLHTDGDTTSLVPSIGQIKLADDAFNISDSVNGRGTKC